MREIVWRIAEGTGGARPHPTDAASARRRLEVGNAAFADLFEPEDGQDRRLVQLAPEELGISSTGAAPEQTPFAAVLSCADARVPVEMLFSQRANDLFVVRVAGNVLGESAMGSLDFSVAQLPSVRLVVVLGHTGCGAVSAAVDTYLDPYSYLALGNSRPLLALVHNLLGPTRLAAHALEQVHGNTVAGSSGYRAALLELAVVANAGVVASALDSRNARRATTVGRHVHTGFGIYDLISRRVGSPAVTPVHDDGTWTPGLLDPPRTRAAFADQLERIAAGQRVVSLLEGSGGST